MRFKASGARGSFDVISLSLFYCLAVVVGISSLRVSSNRSRCPRIQAMSPVAAMIVFVLLLQTLRPSALRP